MSMDIREHLQSDLETSFHLLATNVSAGVRPQNSTTRDLVWRCTKYVEGEDMKGPTPDRTAQFEIVIWAESLAATLAVRDAIRARYHGTEGYEFGGDLENDEEPLEIDSSRKLDEYDGDRVTDTFSESGWVALTLVFEFMWTEI